MGNERNNKEKKPSFLAALSVIVFLFVIMVIQIFVLHEEYVTHITLIIAAVYATIIAFISGFTWEDVQKAILYGCEIAMLPMLILMLVGILIASWILAGTIPTLIYYGLKALSPSVFLVTVCFICAVSSVSTGSSWTTAATFGVAFMGIGYGLNIPPAMTAGAIISGAIFGDKMSPLSDSTNLAAGVAEANLFEHIKSMLYTTGPAFIISLILYAILGLRFKGGIIDTKEIDIILNGLKENFFISPVTIIPAIVVVILAVKKVSGLAVMVIASLVGGVFAIVFQGYGLGEILRFMNDGFVSTTGIEQIDSLLSRGGLQSMMWTISLGFIALSFGGILEKTRVLEVLLEKMSGLVNNVRGLITTHVLSSIAVNLFTASQFMAILLPSRMLLPAYKNLNILPQVNSRTSEDSATVTSPLVPWGLCGVFFTGALGVPTVEYMPYVFLAYITPIIAIIYGITDKFIFREGDIESSQTYNALD
ncbi:Na+/H+ antiporter NhaC [Anaerosalibacter massiliensis]|uniref:Na+/H+ antiporter NhaC n=1 Tax=Anaerosalibacter massiliensis TaxID=1347392 RepID=A0A9X2MKC0_9FIRM|nr:Na+/H+ antiporter NhaC [Anaerosalibacter massiliensis]MCR2045184.1 Na+/H+ antiporter NhaC [Anaerosalibacter massiliensis]